MTSDFKKILMVAQETHDHIATHPDGITLREFKKHVKGLLGRYGLEEGAYIYYDRITLDILETAGAITKITEPREPTRLVAKHAEE